MNGLKYIRTRCNLSLSELADMIGVSRQALSSWENGRKDIPEQRVEQLAEFFGVNREFLGEISDEMKNELIDKAMFRYDENGKEYYRFRPQEGVTSLDQTRVSFFFDNSQKSLDEEYILARHKKQEMLEAIKNIIKWTENAGSISAQIVCINRGCYVYGMINEMMEEMKKKDAHLKMPFFYELVDVWKAMLVAYGIIDVHKSQGSEYPAVILAAASAAPSLLVRGVLYTAITRARRLLILAGDDAVLAQMAANNKQQRRYSGLRRRLKEGYHEQ